MIETKKKRGGKREGAGRKPTIGVVKNVGVRVPQDIVDILDRVDNKASFICQAIREKAERDGMLNN